MRAGVRPLRSVISRRSRKRSCCCCRLRDLVESTHGVFLEHSNSRDPAAARRGGGAPPRHRRRLVLCGARRTRPADALHGGAAPQCMLHRTPPAVAIAVPLTMPTSTSPCLQIGDWGRQGSPNQTLVAELMGRKAAELRPQFIVSSGGTSSDAGRQAVMGGPRTAPFSARGAARLLDATAPPLPSFLSTSPSTPPLVQATIFTPPA